MLLPRLTAASACFGLALQVGLTTAAHGSLPVALWIELRYFTIWVNAAVALCFVRQALGRGMSPVLRGALTLDILLVAVVYHLLLTGPQTGPEQLADLFLHTVTPALVTAYWLVGAPHGALRLRDVAPWTAAPLIYLGCALARGAAGGGYPYPFLDVSVSGWAAVARNAAGVAAAFLAAGAALVWLDRRLGAGRRRHEARRRPTPSPGRSEQA